MREEDIKKISFAIGLFMMVLLHTSEVIATTETYKVNIPIDLQFTCTLNNAIPSASTQYNITIKTQNGTTLVNNKQATSQGNGAFNYTTTFTEIGTYKVLMFCYDGTYSYSGEGYYEITGNGKEKPDGVIVVLFSLVILIIMGFFLYETIICIGHFASLDLDVIDLAKSIGVYFAVFVVYILSLTYLGNPTIESWLLLVIKIGAFTNFIVPVTGFLISITVGSLKKKKVDFGTSRILRRKAWQ